MSGGVEVIGLAELRANIEKAIRENAANIEKAVSRIGDVALLESTKRAPIDEGHLTASIKKHMGRDEDGMSVAVMIPRSHHVCRKSCRKNAVIPTATGHVFAYFFSI